MDSLRVLAPSWQEMTDEEEMVGLALIAQDAMAEDPVFEPWDEVNDD